MAALNSFVGTLLPMHGGRTQGRQSRSVSFTVRAAVTKKKTAPEAPKKQSFFSGVIDALDFSEVRSKSDAQLLYDAKLKKKGEKLTPEQAKALRRKVGGTAKDYWKTWVDVKGDYVEKGYVPASEEEAQITVPGLPFLVATILGIFATLGYVVSQTS